MPKANGFQVCRAIRQQLQPTKIIVISGRDYGVDRASALEAGADEYLVKPITWELLSADDRAHPPGAARASRRRSNSHVEFHTPATRIKLWGVRGSIPVPGPDHRSLRRQHQLRRSAGRWRDHRPRRRLRHSLARHGTGERVRRAADQALASAHAHPLGPHPGLPVFPPGLSARKTKSASSDMKARAPGSPRSSPARWRRRSSPSACASSRATSRSKNSRRWSSPIGKVRVQSKFANHPGICAGYRLFTSCGSVAFFPDNEPYELLKIAYRRSRQRERARRESLRR